MLWPEHLASCPRGNLLANVGDGSKVDVSECPADVRFGSKADIAVRLRNVRFTRPGAKVLDVELIKMPAWRRSE